MNKVIMLVIVMITLSTTGVWSQNTIHQTMDGKILSHRTVIYANSSIKEMPEYCVDRYLKLKRSQGDGIIKSKKKEEYEYTNFIFFFKTTEHHHEWQVVNGVVVKDSPQIFTNTKVAWWMVCAMVAMVLCVITYRMSNGILILVSIAYIIASVFVSTGVVALDLISFAATLALVYVINVPTDKQRFKLMVSVILITMYMIFMYLAF